MSSLTGKVLDLPYGERTAPGRHRAPSSDAVPGILCGNGHFNHPGWRHCRTCGSLLLVGSAPALGPRPTIGVLIRGDGVRTTLRTALYVVLYEAGGQPTCVSPDEAGCPIFSMRIELLSWHPYLVAEAPGAWLAAPDSGPLPVAPGVPTPLLHNWWVSVGPGYFAYESFVPGPELGPLPYQGSPAVRVAGSTMATEAHQTYRPGKGRHRARRPRLPDRSLFPPRANPLQQLLRPKAPRTGPIGAANMTNSHG